MVDDGLDEAVSLEVLDGDTGEGAVDLHSVDEDGLGDHLERGDLLEDSVEGDLVDDDSVVRLVLYFSLGPLLFLAGLALGCDDCLGLSERVSLRTSSGRSIVCRSL